MMKYVVKMRNPRTGRIEVYSTEADDMEQVERGLDIFREGGYEILDYQEIVGEGHSESVWRSE